MLGDRGGTSFGMGGGPVALAIDREPDHVRVLSDLSGHVVGALIDEDADGGPDTDAFTQALRRYREEGAPPFALSWRAARAPRSGARESDVLRRLARDLLKGISLPHEPGATDERAEPAPANVRAITEAREVPALELASDGTWRPSGSAVSPEEEIDASTLRRSVPSARSRYPHIVPGDRVILPPAPPVVDAAPPPAPVADVVEVVPVRLEEPVAPESVIREVASGTEVIAGPFARFQQLAEFVKALRAMPGVQDVTTRQFVRGMVHLRVRHPHTVALAERVMDLADFRPTIVSSTYDRIEIRVDLAE